jgi:mRNA interferase HigB
MVVPLSPAAAAQGGAMAHVISKRRLRQFWQKHHDAEKDLMAWYKAACKAPWTTIAEVRELFPTADQVGRCLVFNIRHNRYRLVVRMSRNWRRIWVRQVLTHKDYDKDEWKQDCAE